VSATVAHARVEDLRDLKAAITEADKRMLAKKEARRAAEGRERRVG
jgi:hypothetical protein